VKWLYDDDAIRESMLDQVIEKAKNKAQHIADALGVKLLGVYDFNETIIDDEDPIISKREMGVARRSQTMPASTPSLEMDIRHNKKVLINVDVEYRVSAF
jgi:uncharacterized protein YggE